MGTFEVGNNVILNDPFRGIKRGIISAKGNSTYNVFSDKEYLKSIPASHIKRNTSKKNKRASLGGLAGNAAYNIVACPTGGTLTDDNDELSYNILKIFQLESLAVLPSSDISDSLDNEMELEVEGEFWDCVGVYARLSQGVFKIGHAVPYLKIGGVWFDGDNSTGLLKKISGNPASDMESRGDVIVGGILYYKKRSLALTGRRPDDWDGVPTYGQHGSTCGTDTIQTILMYADGFYESLNLGVYLKVLKPNIDVRFSYKSILAKPYTKTELEAERLKLLGVLGIVAGPINVKEDRKLIKTIDKQDVVKALNFFIYMIIRFYSLDTKVRRNGGKRRTRRVKN